MADFDYELADRQQQAALRGEYVPSEPERMTKSHCLSLIRDRAAQAAGKLPTLTGDCSTPTRSRRVQFHGWTIDLTDRESAALAARVVAAQRAIDALVELTHRLEE